MKCNSCPAACHLNILDMGKWENRAQTMQSNQFDMSFRYYLHVHATDCFEFWHLIDANEYHNICLFFVLCLLCLKLVHAFRCANVVVCESHTANWIMRFLVYLWRIFLWIHCHCSINYKRSGKASKLCKAFSLTFHWHFSLLHRWKTKTSSLTFRSLEVYLFLLSLCSR